jgi:hypothetical protein
MLGLARQQHAEIVIVIKIEADERSFLAHVYLWLMETARTFSAVSLIHQP